MPITIETIKRHLESVILIRDGMHSKTKFDLIDEEVRRKVHALYLTWEDIDFSEHNDYMQKESNKDEELFNHLWNERWKWYYSRRY